MANKIATVPLTIGLDQVSPPLLAPSGALLACLNYEMTDIAGYRRIDGYERYDGYPNGAIYEYYRIAITASDSGDQPTISAGGIISRVGAVSTDIGVVLNSGEEVDGVWYYDIAPFGDANQFILDETLLTLSDGESLLELSDGEGVLGLVESELGETFTYTEDGSAFVVEMASTPIAGRTLTDAETYLDNLRDYSSILRGLVQDASGSVAGLYWFEDRLLLAVNALTIQVQIDPLATQPTAGVLMRWDGNNYRLLDAALIEESTLNTYVFSLAKIGTADTINDNLVEITPDGTTVATWQLDVSGNGNPSTTASDWAYIVYCNNPSISTTRGHTYLPAATDVAFIDGTYAGTFAPPITLEDGVDATDQYYVVGTDGAVLKARLSQIVDATGSYSAGDAAGTAQLIVTEVVSGSRDYVMDTDEVHLEYPTTGSSIVFTVSGTPTISKIAGTNKLDVVGTKYVWGTYNFYGQSSTLSAHGATGASRSFWANENGFGIIQAIPDEVLDKPKYLAFHVGKLALGYAGGSLLLSVAGEAYNFQGDQGALEIATGDVITGLVELPGDTLAIFGRRAIRKITGYTDADTKLATIAAKSSCFDYTACSIGQDAVFTGIHGISTLQQSSAYGDFKGSNVSDSVSTWLRPKLVRSRPGFEVGGVICAFPVRGKAQYRLVLATGEVVVATFTQEGPKITVSNWGMTGVTKLPYAWSSEVSSEGLERIHVSWSQTDLRNRVIELDTGWGFDGRVMKHYFDVCHMFNPDGTMAMGVERCRLYGQGYGVATLDIKSSGIEDDFFQDYHDAIQDISMPATADILYDRMLPVTSIIDQQNWGLGIKLRIQGSNEENSTLTEPSHICQVIVLHLRTEGAQDT